MNRRDFIKMGASLSTAMVLFPKSLIARSAPKANSELGKVKIKDVKIATIRLGYYNTQILKVTTDSGLYGLGEAYPNTAGIYDNINFIKDAVIGEDPLHVEYLFHKMLVQGKRSSSRTGAMSGAIAGIETALWDLAGKILNVPVYILLGGKFHEKLLIYHDTGAPEHYLDPEAWLEIARESVDYGFKAIKFDFSHRNNKWSRTISNKEVQSWVKVVEKTRDFLGSEFKFGIDLKYKNNLPDALRTIHALEEFDLWFIEDPLPPLNIPAMKKVTDESSIPIMTGEHFWTRQTWRELIETQACDYIHPDTQKCGGLLETKRIADWADLYYIPMACHNRCSPVGTMASAHLCTATRSFFTLESDSIDLAFWKDLIIRDSQGKFYKNGYLTVSDKPGLGIELNEDVCKANLAPGSSFFK
jgi:L-alanine-DL-glutamate epimerase-like enolase superfamily enzyme